MDSTTASDAAHSPAERPAEPSALRRRLGQLGTVARLELGRSLRSGRGAALFVLASLPVLALAGRAAFLAVFDRTEPAAAVTPQLAAVVQTLILGMVVFFGCAAVLSHAVRRDLLQGTLHHWFLLPVRREVLMAGKYLGGAAAVTLVTWAATVVSFVLAYLPSGLEPFLNLLLDGPILGHLLGYLGLVLLAVLGYGAVFFVFGLFFRRPIFPVIVFFGWESVNFLLPPLLKKLSITWYLGGLMPVPVPLGPFAVLAEYPSPWLAVPGLLLVVAALLALAGWKARRMEVLYGDD